MYIIILGPHAWQCTHYFLVYNQKVRKPLRGKNMFFVSKYNLAKKET